MRYPSSAYVFPRSYTSHLLAGNMDLFLSYLRAKDDFSGMGIFHLDVRASAKTNVVLDVETEQRTGFAARLGDDEIVKGQVVGENQILFGADDIIPETSQ